MEYNKPIMIVINDEIAEVITTSIDDGFEYDGEEF